jgi:hypothetical protein
MTDDAIFPAVHDWEEGAMIRELPLTMADFGRWPKLRFFGSGISKATRTEQPAAILVANNNAQPASIFPSHQDFKDEGATQ